jgi:hypothetical protein
MSEVEVLNGPFRFLVFCLPPQTGSKKSELVTIRFLILILGLEMAGIVPPFGFEFRMRKMILRK